MQQQVFIPSENRFREIISETVESLIEQKIPEIIRKATRKEYLTTAEFKDLTGCSYRMQQYYRDEGILPYSQEGRKIFYKTTDVETFMEERRVNAKDREGQV